MADSGQIFDVADLLDKDMFAKKKLTAFWDYPGSKDTFTIAPGGNAGKLFSYVHSKNDVDTLWFMFDRVMSAFDPLNTGGLTHRSYYIKYEPGAFDKNAIIEQGAKSEQQKKEDKAAEDNPIKYYIEKYGPKVIAVTAAVLIGKELIVNAFNNNRNAN